MEKKYITTEKHPQIKSGFVFKTDSHGNLYLDDYPTIRIDAGYADMNIKSGYIKELQEPTWTDQDMIDFGIWAMKNDSGDDKLNFMNWYNQRIK